VPRTLVLFLILLFLVPPPAQPAIRKHSGVTICVEDRFWPPNSFFVNGKAKGTHISLLEAAFKAINLEYSFLKMPWKRCLAAVEKGEVDAVLAAEFREERKQIFRYPAGTPGAQSHSQAVEMMEFIVVTRAGTDVTSLAGGDGIPPNPVGVPLGYLSEASIQSLGQETVEIMNHKDLFDLLDRQRVNSLLLSRTLFDFFHSHPDYSGKYTAHKINGHSGPLYLPFSMKSTLSPETIQTIWQAIESQHRDADFFAASMKAAYHLANDCFNDMMICK